MSQTSTTEFTHYLWKASVTDKDFRFLHQDKLPNFGFASVYAVTKETATELTEKASYSGYKGEVWSPYLWVDVDNYEKAHDLKGKLDGYGIGYRMYDSGNKGCHFAIVRNDKPSHLLPYKDKEYIQTITADADLSIYTHLHLFRQPGARHEKSGRHKSLLSEQQGSSISLEHVEGKEPKRFVVDPAAVESGSLFDSWYVMSNTMPCHNGERHTRLLRSARSVRNHGKSAQFALEWLVEVNKRFSEPKEDAELERIVNWIYSE